MLINVSRPLQFFQWFTYILVIIGVQILVILPLSGILFHDCYTRLFPSDSSQYVPLMSIEQYDEHTFGQVVSRVPMEQSLPVVIDNGLYQKLPLRDNIQYKMDVDIRFYCLHNSFEEQSNIEMLDFQINAVMKNKFIDKTLIYRKKTPIICLNKKESIVEDEIHKFGKSRLSIYDKEWANRILVDDLISVSSDVYELQYNFIVSDQRLIFDSKSNVFLRMEFKQGLRNLMLRWRKLTYTIGTLTFYIVIITFFFITTSFSFFYLKSLNIVTPAVDIKL